MFRKLLVVSGSGAVSVTVGLSSVGPPPVLMMIQLFASATTAGAFGDDFTAEDIGVEVSRASDVLRHDEVGEQDARFGGRERRHISSPLTAEGGATQTVLEAW